MYPVYTRLKAVQDFETVNPKGYFQTSEGDEGIVKFVEMDKDGIVTIVVEFESEADENGVVPEPYELEFFESNINEYLEEVEEEELW